VRDVRLRLALVAATLVFGLPSTATEAGARPPSGRAVWIWYLSRSDGGRIAAIAAHAHASGVRTLMIKAADGVRPWAQFNRRTVGALRAHHLHVCAWQYVYGTHPVGEAAAAARAARAGAECLIIDAEAEYEGRYAAAQVYLHRLRAAVGHRYRVGLASFPYVDYHPAFPYSVFLGPGGAQFDLPQMYWRDIGTSVDAVYRHTYATNRIYGRPILPLGQVDNGAPGADVRRFRALAVRYHARGVSWWDFAWVSANGLWPAVGGPFVPAAGLPGPGFRVLRRGDRGDDVLWLQEHLAAVFRRQRLTGLFGSQTAHNVRAFQARRRLPVTGGAGPLTWVRLRRLHPVRVSWATQRALAARALRAPRSASLPPVADEIPPLGSDQHTDPGRVDP
jgi:putative peptidoglycan binding protein